MNVLLGWSPSHPLGGEGGMSEALRLERPFDFP